jgi:hypothetical protein
LVLGALAVHPTQTVEILFLMLHLLPQLQAVLWLLVADMALWVLVLVLVAALAVVLVNLALRLVVRELVDKVMLVALVLAQPRIPAAVVVVLELLD